MSNHETHLVRVPSAPKKSLALTLAAVVTFAPLAAAQADETETPARIPEVSDPMLEPPSLSFQRAPVIIASWADALSRVHTRSPEYAKAMASIGRAEAQARIALAPLLPTLAGEATYAHSFKQLQIALGSTNLSLPPADVGTLEVTADWTPINVRAFHDWETAKRSVDVTTIETEDRRRQLANDVVSAMLATMSATRVADLNRVGLRAALERQGLTEARVLYGQAAALDVDRAKKDVASARRLVVDGDESLRIAREALAVALGSPEPMTVAPDLDLEGFEHDVGVTCRFNDAIESRPDIVAARGRVDLAKRAVTSAQFAPLPTVAIETQAAHSTNPTFGPDDTYSFTTVLSVPLYDGGLRYGQLRDARAVEEQAEAALEAARLGAIMSVARTKRAVEIARTDRDVSKTERDLAAEIDARTRDAYARGQGTSLGLVTAAEQLRSAEINLALLDFQYAEARASAVLEDAQCTF
jgi:multidrug efflux system outer membrane protein